jgi:cytochrome c-type biogenesis protein CcmH/NrfF
MTVATNTGSDSCLRPSSQSEGPELDLVVMDDWSDAADKDETIARQVASVLSCCHLQVMSLSQARIIRALREEVDALKAKLRSVGQS